jgi:large subunit ribosomal protein L22
MSPRKVRLVADLVRGMDVTDALAQLKFVQKAAVRPVTKLIESAMANASHNHQLDASGLYIKKIAVDDGPTLKRWRARAHGRAASIMKRSSHISVVLDVRGSDDAGLDAAVVRAAEKSDEKRTPARTTPLFAKGGARTAKTAPAKTAQASSDSSGKVERKSEKNPVAKGGKKTASAKKAGKDE